MSTCDIGGNSPTTLQPTPLETGGWEAATKEIQTTESNSSFSPCRVFWFEESIIHFKVSPFGSGLPLFTVDTFLSIHAPSRVSLNK